ncbi:MAG: energy-coupling factor transporter transmembrane component T [Pseudomonadota bacterium]
MAMRHGILDLWGCAGGPVTGLAPRTRLAAGFLLFSVCMVAAPDTAAGFSFLLITVAAWLIACRVPAADLSRMMAFGLIMFLPFFLLTPWTGPGPRSASWMQGPELLEAAAVPWRVFARGLGGMLVSMATMASVSVVDFHSGMSRLPLPRVLVGLLAQIIHQAGALVGETRRIAAAMAVRGASGRTRSSWRILTSLPTVWLPRVATRVERVAAAMELRGFDPGTLFHGHEAMRPRDWIVLLSAAAWLALAVAFRLGGRG